MRIAIIAEVFLPKIDGVVQRTLNLIRQLVNFGDQVMVVCPQAEGCGNCPVPVVTVPSFPFALYPEYRIGIPERSLSDAIERFKPEVLHYVNPFAFGFICHDQLQRAGLRVPSVFSFHTLYGEFAKRYRVLKPLSWLLWWLMRDYHNRADLNLTVSSITQKELVDRGFERVELWPPAVDSKIFCPEAKSTEMRARLANGHPDQRLLLTVSRLAPEKNVGLLGHILDRIPNACLAIVGDGPQRPELERLFAGRNVNFVGYLTGAELAAAYASADAFVYASETETMGNVVLEALACGCAVVAPDAGGIPSLVEPGKTAILYPPGRVDEAARAVHKILNEPAFRSQLGRQARQAVETWTWCHSIEQVRAIYSEAISRQRPPADWTVGHRLSRATLSILVSSFRAISAIYRRETSLPASEKPLAI